MATTIELTEILAKKQAEYDSLTTEIVNLQKAGNDWINDAKNDKIRTTKANKAKDIADRDRKLALGQSYLDQAQQKKALQAQLVKDMDAIRETLKAKDEQGKILAGQGISQSAKEIEANATADAIKTSSTITAQAQAKALETQTASDAQAQKTKQYIIYGVVAILFVVFVLLLMKKLKKLKK
nr:hypothetical protein [uncultured Fluviicola sp.]